jgi:hypothetical protein
VTFNRARKLPLAMHTFYSVCTSLGSILLNKQYQHTLLVPIYIVSVEQSYFDTTRALMHHKTFVSTIQALYTLLAILHEPSLLAVSGCSTPQHKHECCISTKPRKVPHCFKVRFSISSASPAVADSNHPRMPTHVCSTCATSAHLPQARHPHTLDSQATRSDNLSKWA